MIEEQKLALTALLNDALKANGIEGVTARLERPKDAAHGDFACTTALQCAKILKKNPREVAQLLVASLNNDPRGKALLAAVEIAGPGFINLTLNKEAALSAVKDVLTKGEDFGKSTAFAGQSVLLEYVSANPTGPLHLGHARQGALGDVLSRVMATQGYKVMREFYYNDAGVQIDNLTLSVAARAKEIKGEAKPEDFPENGYHGDYIMDIARDYLAKKPVVTTAGETVDARTTRKTSAAMQWRTFVTNKTATLRPWALPLTTSTLKVRFTPPGAFKKPLKPLKRRATRMKPRGRCGSEPPTLTLRALRTTKTA